MLTTGSKAISFENIIMNINYILSRFIYKKCIYTQKMAICTILGYFVENYYIFVNGDIVE